MSASWVVLLLGLGLLLLLIAALWNAGSRGSDIDPLTDEHDPNEPDAEEALDEPMGVGRLSSRFLWVLAISTPIVAIGLLGGVLLFLLLPFNVLFAIVFAPGLLRGLAVVMGIAGVWLTTLWMLARLRQASRDR